MIPPVTQYSNKQLREIAERFFCEHHPSGQIPVPVEEIAEFGLELDIVPIPDLEKRYATAGFISADLTTVTVDARFFKRNYVNRLRFTLAHEIGHAYLHREQIEVLGSDTIEGWKGGRLLISDFDYETMECQADEFAAQVLVPRQPLVEVHQEALGRLEALGLDFDAFDEEARSRVVAHMADRFTVSSGTMWRRLRRERLI